MCKNKNVYLNNLHKNLKVLPIGRKVCHNGLFYPRCILTSMYIIRIVNILKESYKYTFIRILVLSKHQVRLKFIINNRAFQIIFLYPINDLILIFKTTYLRTLKLLGKWTFNQCNKIIKRILRGKIDLTSFKNFIKIVRTWHNHQQKMKWLNFLIGIWTFR